MIYFRSIGFVDPARGIGGRELVLRAYSRGAAGEQKTPVSTRTHPNSTGVIIERFQSLGLSVTYSWLLLRPKQLPLGNGEVDSSILSGSTSYLTGCVDFTENSVLSATQVCHTDQWFP